PEALLSSASRRGVNVGPFETRTEAIAEASGYFSARVEVRRERITAFRTAKNGPDSRVRDSPSIPRVQTQSQVVGEEQLSADRDVGREWGAGVELLRQAQVHGSETQAKIATGAAASPAEEAVELVGVDVERRRGSEGSSADRISRTERRTRVREGRFEREVSGQAEG